MRKAPRLFIGMQARIIDMLCQTETAAFFFKKLQEYCAHHVTLVLGSGASCGYGIPGMSDLASDIALMPALEENADLQKLAANLSRKGANLEKELSEAPLQPEIMAEIRKVVWRRVLRGQLNFLGFHYFRNPEEFSLVHLFSALLQSSNPVLNVVTTNYDLLAELAADACGADCITGFNGQFYSTSFSRDDFAARKRSQRSTVRLFKVHGSLNWFKETQEYRIFALKNFGMPPLELLRQLNSETELSSALGKEATKREPDADLRKSFAEFASVKNQVLPLIIPPSSKKYEEAFNEPYRSLISLADEEFRSASTVLCIGYGFNDNHIQEDLKSAVLSGNTQLVVACKELSRSCLELIYGRKRPNVKYLLLERLPLHVIFNCQTKTGLLHLPDQDFSSLDDQLCHEINAKREQGMNPVEVIDAYQRRGGLHVLFQSGSLQQLSAQPAKWLNDLMEKIWPVKPEQPDKKDQNNSEMLKVCRKWFEREFIDDLKTACLWQCINSSAKSTDETPILQPEAADSGPDTLPATPDVLFSKGSSLLKFVGRAPFRDDFTFIHSSDKSLDGRIVYGRYWSVDGLADVI